MWLTYASSTIVSSVSWVLWVANSCRTCSSQSCRSDSWAGVRFVAEPEFSSSFIVGSFVDFASLVVGMLDKSNSLRADIHTSRSKNWKSPVTFSAAVADVDDVAVLDDVLFAFDVELAGFLELHFGGVPHFRRGFGGQAGGGPDQVAVFHHLGADEAAGQVRVNGVCGIDGCASVADGPGAHFVFAAGEKRDVAESFVETTGKNVDGRFRDAQGGQELGMFSGILDLGHLGRGLG